MNKSFLITRPNHDDTTHYLFYWSKQLIEFAKKKGIFVFDLLGKKANKEEFTSYIHKKNPSLIILNGHGAEDMVTGHDMQTIIKVGENDILLKSRITYAISCRSAKKLGPESIKSGAKAYIGYSDDFIFFYEPTKITNPLNDNTARLFLEPSNELVSSLLKGNTVGESCERSKGHFRDNIKKLLTSESSDESQVYVRYLWWNMRNQACLGDKNAVF